MGPPLSPDWAEVYDDYATGIPGDESFYVAEARDVDGEILELGCGTGRILIPIAQVGKTITGLDVTSSMLDVCRERLAELPAEVRERVTLVEGDMRDFDLGRKFPLIICPYRAFLHNLTIEDQLATLGRVRRHLSNDGRFVLNFFDPFLHLIVDHTSAEDAWRRVYRSYFDSTTGNQVDVHETTWFDPTEQVAHVKYRFIEVLPDETQRLKTVKELHLRWIHRFEMEHLFARSGLRVLHLFGSFDREQFRHGREQIWIVSAS